MMENGLYHFYNSFSKFLVELQESKMLKQKYEVDAKQGITMEQIIIPLIGYLVGSAISLAVFLIEIIVQKFTNRK